MRRVLLFLTLSLILLSVIQIVSAQTLTVDGLERSYILHVPRGLNPDQPIPLLIAMHGGGGNARQMQRYTGFNRVANREGFVVVYPQGIEDRWNDGRVFEESPQTDDVEFIEVLIDHLIKTRNIDPQRVYATGISNGGFMSYRLGCELSDRIAGIAPVTANLSIDLAMFCEPAHSLKVLIINGTDDPLVPYEGGEVRVPLVGNPRGEIHSTDESVRFWAAHNSCTADPLVDSQPDVNLRDESTVEIITYTDCDAPVQLLSVIGGGHTWPGAAQYLPVVGGVNRDIHASDVIWEFFRAE
jgi:polyhydroxybutyrate depolymerase